MLLFSYSCRRGAEFSHLENVETKTLYSCLVKLKIHYIHEGILEIMGHSLECAEIFQGGGGGFLKEN